MNIVNHVYDDIKEITQVDELLNSSQSSTHREWVVNEMNELFNIEISIFEEGGKTSAYFKDNKNMNKVIENYSNNPYYSTDSLERDFRLSTEIIPIVTYDAETDITHINLDKEYYKEKYNIKDILIANLMNDTYFEYKYGTVMKQYPTMIREYIKRARKISKVVEKCNKRLEEYSNDNILNIVLVKRTMLCTTISNSNELIFDVEYNISDDGIMKVIIKPTWQFKKMHRKIEMLYKPSVYTDGVRLKFKNCTPLLSKNFMHTTKGIVDKFNKNKEDKWIVKRRYVDLIGDLFKMVENENNKPTENNLHVIYELNLNDLNRLELSARYFTITGQELNIVDKYYQEVTNYRMYESPTIDRLLLRNKKDDFEDAMYMLNRYNKNHKIPYILDRGILIPSRSENDLYEGYVRDVLSQYIDFICNRAYLRKERPDATDLEMEFDDTFSWRYELPKIIITLK